MKKMPILLASVAMGLTVGTMAASAAEVKNPDTFVIAVSGAPKTMDPISAYDSASGEIIYQLHEGLITYDGASTDNYVPAMATKVPTIENGLISKDGKTYRFPIRQGIKFHNGDVMTPADVEYTFERGVLANIADGPFWMIIEPLFGVQSIMQMVDPSGKLDDIKKATPAQLKAVYDKVDKAIEVDGNDVVFKLTNAYGPFLDILCGTDSWAAITDKKYTIAKGGWDGKADTWAKWYDLPTEKCALYDDANGTGPYKLKKWDKSGKQIILERFDEYWRGPAKIKNVVVKEIAEFNTRKLMLQNGDADAIYVPTNVMSQVEGMDGVTVKKHLSSNADVFMVFNQEIINNGGNDYVGSGKLDGKGIPSNFFADLHVRRGFQYVTEYDALIKQVLAGEGVQSYGPIPFNFKYVDKNDKKRFDYDIEKARKEFKQAFDGELWKKGFEMVLVYNTGNTVRQTACEMIKVGLQKVNPKFKVEVRGIAWPTLLGQRTEGRLPAYIMGWHADYTDAHNFVVPLLHSQGDYTKFSGRPAIATAKKQFDPLINAAIKETDSAKRKALYQQVQDNFRLYVPLLMLYDSYNIRVMRDYVKGWKHNPARTGEGYYFWELDK